MSFETKKDVVFKEVVNSSANYYAAAGSSEGNPFFRLDPGMVIWTWVLVFLLVAILYKFAWKPILNSLDKREKKIRDSLENAERIEQKMLDADLEYQRILNDAKTQAKSILVESRKSADSLKEEIEITAKKNAENIIKKAEDIAAKERERLLISLKKETINISLKIASVIINKNMDVEKNKEMSKKMLENINGKVEEIL